MAKIVVCCGTEFINVFPGAYYRDVVGVGSYKGVRGWCGQFAHVEVKEEWRKDATLGDPLFHHNVFGGGIAELDLGGSHKAIFIRSRVCPM